MTDIQQHKNFRQLPLEFAAPNYMEEQDFMVTDCNREAYTIINSWPNWISNGLFVYGPKGCGKSHLANIFAAKLARAVGKPAQIQIIKASAVNNRNVQRISKETPHIIIEDITANNNNEALFHLFNLYNTAGRYMLWTGINPPQRIPFGLKDLQSRLNMLPAVAVKEPDDLMLRMLIAKLFNDRQILITPEIMQYIINNCQRSFIYIENLVAEIDSISLAYQSAVNYNIVKKAMQILKEKDTAIPDLFDEY